jgi:hypothetical protein
VNRRAVRADQFQGFPAGHFPVEVDELDGTAPGLAAVAEALERGEGVEAAPAFGHGHRAGAGGENGVEDRGERMGVGREELAAAEQARLDQDVRRNARAEIVGDQRQGLGRGTATVVRSNDGHADSLVGAGLGSRARGQRRCRTHREILWASTALGRGTATP